MIELFSVYLIDLPNNNEKTRILKGKHFGLVLSEINKKDNTLLIAPITSKKIGKKYRGGFTIDNKKYQKHPKYEYAFIKLRKIREIDKTKIISKKKFSLDKEDLLQLKIAFEKFFNKILEIE
ncbi:type II toxin-antitoxin system PemK/MazF family toxin [Streptobacillus canis]|uniref:type II toxin-antitoxin system PemK/MazF family toxin n=1 Tax=Streptobacillus canis TaxID=2678686 RepID=UPI0012E24AAD|nr:type II toxin-antitoxin system PemK/MazF family toxin [Streptobacillus canis]